MWVVFAGGILNLPRDAGKTVCKPKLPLNAAPFLFSLKKATTAAREWATTESPKSATDKNFENLLKNYFLLKNFYNHRLCWNSSPKCGTLTWWGGLSGLIKY